MSGIQHDPQKLKPGAINVHHEDVEAEKARHRLHESAPKTASADNPRGVTNPDRRTAAERAADEEKARAEAEPKAEDKTEQKSDGDSTPAQ